MEEQLGDSILAPDQSWNTMIGIFFLTITLAIGIVYVFILVQSSSNEGSNSNKTKKSNDEKAEQVLAMKKEEEDPSSSVAPVELKVPMVTQKKSSEKKSKLPSLDELFKLAAESIRKGPNAPTPVKDIDMKTKFLLYAYYKQATEGTVKGDRPGMFAVVDRSKYDAWAGLGAMQKEEAQQKYIDIVKDMFGGVIPLQPKPEPDSPAEVIPVAEAELISDQSMDPLTAKSRTSSTDSLLDEKFQEAVTSVGRRLNSIGKGPFSPKPKTEVDTKLKLQLYAYYKQATCGPVNKQTKPGKFSKDRSKYDAWAALKDLDSNTAKEKYISLVEELFGIDQLQSRASVAITNRSSFTASVEETFQEAVLAIGDNLHEIGKGSSAPKPVKEIDEKIKLRLYAYFKQATVGEPLGGRPGRFNAYERSKYDAWKACRKMTKEEAMQRYIEVVKDIFGGVIPK